MIRTLLFLLVFATVAHATQVEERTLDQLVSDADHIVVGKVEAVRMYGWLGIQNPNPAARTGPGSSNELRWTVSVQPPGVLYSNKKDIPADFTIRLWRKWHMSLEGACYHEGKTYILLLKGDDLQWVYPAFFYRDMDELDEVKKLIQKKKTEPNKAMEPTPVNVTIPADAGLAPFTSAAHL